MKYSLTELNEKLETATAVEVDNIFFFINSFISLEEQEDFETKANIQVFYIDDESPVFETYNLEDLVDKDIKIFDLKEL